MLPADENSGISFERVDVPGSRRIPANIEYLMPSHRRTVLGIDDVTVEMTEHLMAALAGLGIDNCHVQIDAPEVPGCDGSSQAFVDAILDVGIKTQTAVRRPVAINQSHHIDNESGASIDGLPIADSKFLITFDLDYGPTAPFPAQSLTVEVTPESFANEIAFARTFVLEAEIEALKARGYGARVSASDLVVFRDDGSVLDNKLRAADECVRHKILDCIGDLALVGSPLVGHVIAKRSGHSFNHQLAKRIVDAQQGVSKAA